MKLPEDEQQAYEHYKDDLHYQASMFESSFVDGYKEGEKRGETKAVRQMVLNMAKENISIEIIMLTTRLTKEEVEFILEKDNR
jgi:hypothetical protein